MICMCIAAVENVEEPRGVLLHVENDGPLRTAEAREGGRGGVQAETSVHSQLVSVCTDTDIHTFIELIYSVVSFISLCLYCRILKSFVSLCKSIRLSFFDKMQNKICNDIYYLYAYL